MKFKSHCARDHSEARGLGARPFAAPSWHWAVRASAAPHLPAALAPPCSITAPLYSQGTNVVSWELPDTPMSPPRPSLLQQPAGKKGVFWRLLECFQNSIKQPCQEGRIFPYFSDKETEARWILKAIVLECGKARREPAANVFIICTFPQF